MTSTGLLAFFIAFRFLENIFLSFLNYLNKKFYTAPENISEAKQALGISDIDFAKTLEYSLDKYRFGSISGWLSLSVTLVFLALGGLGLVENVSQDLILAIFGPGHTVLLGLTFFALLGLISMVMSLPLSYYSTFIIEEKHGFNRQTRKGFWLDQLKGLVLGVVLGGVLLAMILWIMEEMGSYWWIYAWLAITGFSLLTLYIYPTLLAPLFNKFTPLSDGPLKEAIDALAKKIGFAMGGISIMNASVRSSHGNAYFTGVFGKKRIVLFDTLVESMSPDEVTAVLAHELGHFKLHHIRSQLIRSTVISGFTFYLFSLCLPMENFYHAFALSGVSNYGALVVFGMWFGLIHFFTQPLTTYLSRRNEFAADAFALQNIDDKRKLSEALLKLREKSQAMPVSHPWYSAYHYSHPPMLERLKAMGYQANHPQGSGA